MRYNANKVAYMIGYICHRMKKNSSQWLLVFGGGAGGSVGQGDRRVVVTEHGLVEDHDGECLLPIVG
jgi:hypothetical protein